MTVAVAIGALLAGCSPNSSDRQDADTGPTGATSSTAPSASVRAARESATSPFAELKRGASPAVGYVTGRVHIAPDGARTRLPVWQGISEIVRYDGGFLIADLRYFEGTSGLHIVEGAGAERIRPCTSGNGVVSVDGSEAAWATFACPESGVTAPTILHRRSATHTTTQQVPGSATSLIVRVEGILGGHLVYGVGFGDGVFVTDLENEPWPLAGLQHATSVDESGGRVAGATGPEGGHGAVVDVATGRIEWAVRRTDLGPFNPSGTTIVAARARSWTVVDAASGTERYVLQLPRRAYVAELAWEDDRHLLAAVQWRREHAIVRFDGRGRPELATPVVTANGPQGGYVLESRP